MATDRKPVDWDAIERDYCAGVLSVREIAAAHGISHTAVQKRAKGDQVRPAWTRDLNAKIRARADELVAKREVATQVATQQMATDRIVIEANAQRIAQVRGEHRADIARMRALVLRLLTECETLAEDPMVFGELGDMMRKPNPVTGQDRLNDAYNKAISLPQRIKGVKELAEAMRVLVTMEREAYGILAADTGAPGDSGATELVMELKRRRAAGGKTFLLPGMATGMATGLDTGDDT